MKTTFASTNSFFALFFVVLTILMTACSPKDSDINPESEITLNSARASVNDSVSTLKMVASFPIGAGPSVAVVKNTNAYKMFFEQFDAKTVHAYMNIEESKGKFNFKEADYWVQQAQSNPMRLHGHCLVYHIATPDWLTKIKATGEFEAVVKNHIQTVVSRYKGKIKSWDVINEIFEANPSNPNSNIKNTIFRALYASDDAYMAFVQRCFVWAHEADPNALLFYNDNAFDNTPARLNGFLKFAADCKRNGIPLHGVGTQMHIDINTPEAGIQSSLKALAATGLQVHISEMDIKVNTKGDNNMVFTTEVLNKQRAKYQFVATAYKQLVPVSQQYGITMWDMGDSDSWIVKMRNEHDVPTLFDSQYKKKPAFFGLLEGLKN
ncbi:endo-1,4-beta-xylanase [Larkinella rosea]|uniref:Beta-xylanase n=1 Tax=Larkinella rosea TaxID=2025312 RepID=A0A3P1BLY4_9BACT|nr:endo-1,4-beta-xylanase [Larkinella rosea]RRB02022.1 1,4-beta-xylanase [Larkinella rosea]